MQYVADTKNSSMTDMGTYSVKGVRDRIPLPILHIIFIQQVSTLVILNCIMSLILYCYALGVMICLIVLGLGGSRLLMSLRLPEG